MRDAQAHAERSAGTRRELEAQVAAKVKEIERQKGILEKELKHKNIMFDELKSNMQAELKVREIVPRGHRAARKATHGSRPPRAGRFEGSSRNVSSHTTGTSRMCAKVFLGWCATTSGSKASCRITSAGKLLSSQTRTPFTMSCTITFARSPTRTPTSSERSRRFERRRVMRATLYSTAPSRRAPYHRRWC